MKSRNAFPPGGWVFIQSQISPAVIGGPSSSFQMCVDLVRQVRQANPWICQQNGLSVDPTVIADEVDEYNAARCLAQPGWDVFVEDMSPPKTWSPTASPRTRQSGGLAAGARKTAAGVRLVADWLGSGLKPVAHDLAVQRSTVCASCPQNGDPNWIQRIDAIVAAEVKTLVEIKNDLKLSTPNDDQLLTCNLCDCYLKLKVHAPITHIWENTSEDIRGKLSKVVTNAGRKCWVAEESQGRS